MYYDGTKLLSLKDLNGKKPEIYLCTTNRTGGKTTYFSRLLVNRFLRRGEKFALLYRFGYELDNVAEEFFKDIKGLFFPEYELTSVSKAKGTYYELYLNEIHCGYALSINNADSLKRKSHVFSDVSNMFFDEFQSETNKYCPNEIQKFISVHTTVARGQGEFTRYVPVYMCANTVTLLNPYYREFNLASRVKSDTKFLRGNGFVLEQGFVADAAEALKQSGFMQAFSGNSYADYAAEAVYLQDSTSFIEKPNKGPNSYLCTFSVNGKDYSIREYSTLGYEYVSNVVDKNFPRRISVTLEDHRVNYVMLQKNDMFISALRTLFNKGCFRFQDVGCKDSLLKFLSYN